MARTLNNLGLAFNQDGDHERARACFEESLAVAREAGDRRGVSMCLNNLAMRARERGDLEAALALYEESLAEARIAGDPGNVALCLFNLAILLLTSGKPTDAGARLLEALGTVRELKLRLLGTGVIQTVAGIAVASGEVALGTRLDGAAEMLFQAMGVARDPLNEQTRASIVIHARSVLGEEAFAQASAAGAVLSYEAALEEARVWLEARATPATSV